MHVRVLSRLAVLTALAVLCGSLIAGAQPASVGPDEPKTAAEKMRNLEVEQQYLRQLVKDSQDTNKYLLATFAALLVAIQIAASFVQAQREERAYSRYVVRENELEERRTKRDELLESQRRRREDEVETQRFRRERRLQKYWAEREGRLEQRRADRDDRLDATTASSVQSIKNLLDIVASTFAERREADREGRDATKSFNDKLDGLTATIAHLNTKIVDLEGFASSVKRTTENERTALEETAGALTRETPRHSFRQKTGQLAEFARDYDSFVRRYALGEFGSEGRPEFSSYVPYIRGIAAHYGNDPTTVEMHLTKVATQDQLEAGETQENKNKRLVVAFYFLGVNEANFANYERALEYFRQAIDLERMPKDILTRIVAAEAAAMGHRPVEALAYLDEIDSILRALEEEHNERKLPFPAAFRRHRHRASLIRANMLINDGESKWDEAITIVRAIDEAHDYYAKATLGQLLLARNPSDAEGRKALQDAHAVIRNLGHLHAVTEVRSKVLLLLVAGMCAQCADGYESMAEEHFAEAERLLPSLPGRGQQACTVFSPLSKRNETANTLLSHIDALRRQTMLSAV